MIELCERYFRSLDDLIAQIVEQAGPEATIVLASDHGFGPTRDVFHVNSWLEQQGYLFWADRGRAAERGGHRRRLRRDDPPRPRARLVAHGRLRGDAVQPGDPHRRPRARAATSRCPRRCARSSPLELAAALREVRASPRRAAAGRGGVDPRAGVLGTVRAARARPLAGARRRRHDVDPALATRSWPAARSPAATTAGRASSSPRARASASGASAEELSIVDVAPLLLHQLGPAGAARTWPGSVPAGLFEPTASSSAGRRAQRARAPSPGGGSGPGRRSSSSPRSRPR